MGTFAKVSGSGGAGGGGGGGGADAELNVDGGGGGEEALKVGGGTDEGVEYCFEVLRVPLMTGVEF